MLAATNNGCYSVFMGMLTCKLQYKYVCVCVCVLCVVLQTGEETERWRRRWRLLATKQLRVDKSALFELAAAYLLSDMSELWW